MILNRNCSLSIGVHGSLTLSCTLSHTPTLCLTLSRSFSHTLSFFFSLALPLLPLQTHTHTPSLMLSHTPSLSQIAHSLSRILILTFVFVPALSFSCSPIFPLALLRSLPQWKRNNTGNASKIKQIQHNARQDKQNKTYHWLELIQKIQ